MELVFTGEFPPVRGGIGTFLHSRCEAPPSDGLRILAPDLDPTHDWDDASPLNISRFKYAHGGSSHLRIKQLWWSYSALKAELGRTDYRLVTASFALPFGWVAVQLRKFGYKIAVFCHGNDIIRPLFHKSTQYLYNYTMKHVDLYIANSSITADKLDCQGRDPKKIVVIHPPVNPLLFHPGIDASRLRESLIKRGGPMILTVSRLDDQRKGIDTVIRLLPRLIRKHPELCYLVVGEGPDMPYLLNCARDSGVERHVKFCGAVMENDLPMFYAACDLFILLSKSMPEIGSYEGFGIVYREAMACGAPTIVSNEAGAREMITPGENGLLVDPNDPDDAFRAIIKLLGNSKQAQELGLRGAETALKPADWSPLNEFGF